MIKGLGTDIIEVSRVDDNISKHGQKFLDKVFTPSEQAYCRGFSRSSSRNYAGRFAAKEAIVKALGTGLAKGLEWLDIEILNDDQGKPYVNFSSKAKLLFQQPTVHVSISHCHEYATATAIWEG